MEFKKAFGKALKVVRKFRGLTLMSFSNISGRTYISEIERGLKSPTIEKIDEIGNFMEIHPITISYLAYLNANDAESYENISKRVEAELTRIQNFKQS